MFISHRANWPEVATEGVAAVSRGRRTNEWALLGIKAARPAMDAILLIADNNARRRAELRRFFWDSGFLVASAAHGLECAAELLTLEPDVLVIALEIPWGGGDGVIARVNDGLPIDKKPLILVVGDAPADTLSERTGVAACNCFSTPFRQEGLLERIGMELAVSSWHGEAVRQESSTETTT